MNFYALQLHILRLYLYPLGLTKNGFNFLLCIAQDPNESEENGWADSGHYVTGCLEDWISLRLVDENGEIDEEDLDEGDSTTDLDGNGGNASAQVDEGTITAFDAISSVVYGIIATFALVLKNLMA